MTPLTADPHATFARAQRPVLVEVRRLLEAAALPMGLGCVLVAAVLALVIG